MKILVEGYCYEFNSYADVLEEVGYTPVDIDKGRVRSVGYCFCPSINDNVFVLPKVVLDENQKLFSVYKPEEFFDLDLLLKNGVINNQQWLFIQNFAIWLYKALKTFKKRNPESSIITEKVRLNLFNSNTASLKSSSLLDVIIALVDFYKNHQNFLLFSLQESHRGLNRINWPKTISRTKTHITNAGPIYLTPISKKQQIDQRDELYVLYFSILSHIARKYGFVVKIPVGVELITNNRFEEYLRYKGTVALKKIKNKYFSDITRQLWKLCYQFFSLNERIFSNKSEKEYLLATNFEIVFESMIDSLISDNNLPPNIKEQMDGKVIDHVFKHKSLFGDGCIYYVGDSKYYKSGAEVSGYSEFKQYTYGRNIVQLHVASLSKRYEDELHYQDELTEGYNVTPNFFISPIVSKKFSFKDSEFTCRVDSTKKSFHFRNRLFDRDTYWLIHFDINLLFVFSMYSKKPDGVPKLFKMSFRDKIRSQLLSVLNAKYDFWILTPKLLSLEVAYSKYFRQLLGKAFKTTSDSKMLILALEKESDEPNEPLLKLLEEDFRLDKYEVLSGV